MVEKVAKIKVPTAGFYGGKQMHGLRHVEARFLKKTYSNKNGARIQHKGIHGSKMPSAQGR